MIKKLLAILFLCNPCWAAVAKVDTATGHACSGNGCTTTSTNFTATISANVTCALVGLNFRNSVSNVTVVWDTTTANQSFAEISTGVFNGAMSKMFVLVNPTAGTTKIVTVNWTTASDVVWTMATFSGTDTSSCINPADTTIATGNSTTVSVTVPGATGDAVLGIGGQDAGNWSATTNGTAITLDNATFVNGAGAYYDPSTTPATGASNQTSWTFPASGAWSAMGVHVMAPGSGQLLVVAGGGAGGDSTGAGGGAGGYVYYPNQSYSAQAYSVTVGAGGTGISGARGNPGANSVFASTTALGGGVGGCNAGTLAGGNGGSGGGGAYSGGAGGSAQANQGTSGGANATLQFGGGGGGGSRAPGTNGPTYAGTSADARGGDGTTSWITGSAVTYGGGGGGGNFPDCGNGGIGGAGGGGNASVTTGGLPGTANTGGGGGATCGNVTGAGGGAGGKGIVVASFPTASFSFTGGDATGTNGSFTWVKFTNNGTLTLSAAGAATSAASKQSKLQKLGELQ